MFYVIDRRTIKAILIIIAILAAAIWLTVSVLTSGKSSGIGSMVFWQLFTGKMGTVVTENDASVPQPVVKTVDNQPKDDLDVGGEQIETSSITVTGTNLRTESTVSGVVEVKPVAGDDSFAEFRIERERSRSQQMEYLKEVIRTAESDAQRGEAEKYLAELMRTGSLESTLEGMIKTRGIPDAIAVITDSGVNILVKDTLTQQEASQIGDMAARVTGTPPTKVKILDGIH